MILECPSCRARYLVQIGLFAQGGRQVRCTRCKHEWHAKLPTNIDVFLPPPQIVEPPPLPPQADMPPSVPAQPVPNLPAVVRKSFFSFWTDLNPKIKRYITRTVQSIVLFAAIITWPLMDRERIVKAIPDLRMAYQGMGFSFAHSGQGLEFNSVKSEIKYDGGTMRLFVDGVVRNTTSEVQFMPNIMARALGPDRRIIQSWWVEAPAPTIAAGEDVPFHTEVNTPMSRTIDDVYLEFYAKDEKGDVVQ